MSAPPARAVWFARPVVAVAVVYLAARAVTTVFLALAAHLSGPASRFGAEATLGSLSMGWDAQWYWLVAEQGYPAQIPTDEAGMVQQNAWAFMPVYPYLVKVVSVLFGGYYPPAAVLVSLVAGYLSCLALHRLLRRHLDVNATLVAVAMFAAGPLSVMFQVGYAEALFLLWLFLALAAVQRRAWGWLYLLVPLMGYTRPGVLAFALLLALYGIRRFLRRNVEPLPRRDVVHIVVVGLIAAGVGFSWPVITGLVTGDPGAYLATEMSWRRGWTGAGDAGFVPFEGFVQAAGIWFSLWGMPAWMGVVALALALIVVALAFVRPEVRRLGAVVTLWSASYLVYLLAVFFPQSSLFRLLLPLSPLYGALAAPRSTLWRAGVIGAGLVGQWWWIYSMYALGNTYTQIP